MKTFLEFISEAENVSSQIAQLRARARMLRQKGDMKGALEVEKQAGELQAGTQAKIGAVSNSDKPKEPESSNTWTRGYASKGKDVRGSAGSLRDIDSGNQPSDVRTSGRYGDTRSRSQGGGSVPTRNRGQGYSTPERSHYSR